MLLARDQVLGQVGVALGLDVGVGRLGLIAGQRGLRLADPRLVASQRGARLMHLHAVLGEVGLGLRDGASPCADRG